MTLPTPMPAAYDHHHDSRPCGCLFSDDLLGRSMNLLED
ncbi:MAG: hypothetical protein RLZZ224_1327 [Verrucomicrobiota bacterium]|jgi:hypothetical protein